MSTSRACLTFLCPMVAFALSTGCDGGNSPTGITRYLKDDAELLLACGPATYASWSWTTLSYQVPRSASFLVFVDDLPGAKP